MYSETQDEIDLLDLSRELWRGKWFIVLVTLIGLLSGVLYLAFHKPNFEARVSLVAPLSTDLAEINYNRNNVSSLRPFPTYEAFSLVRNVLFTASLSQFKAMKNGDSNKSASIKIEANGQNIFTIVAVAHSKESALDSLKHILTLTNQISVKELNDSLNHEIAIVKKHLGKQIKLEQEAQGSAIGPAEAKIFKLKQEYDALSPITLEHVSLVRVEGGITVSDTPVGPNSKRILAMFLIVGFILGSMILICRQIKRHLSA